MNGPLTILFLLLFITPGLTIPSSSKMSNIPPSRLTHKFIIHHSFSPPPPHNHRFRRIRRQEPAVEHRSVSEHIYDGSFKTANIVFPHQENMDPLKTTLTSVIHIPPKDLGTQTHGHPYVNENSAEFNLAMINYLLAMKAKGHKINEVNSDKPLVELHKDLKATKATDGNLQDPLICKTAPYNICYKIDKYGILHPLGNHRPDTDWLAILCHMANGFSKLNRLNKSLQVKDTSILKGEKLPEESRAVERDMCAGKFNLWLPVEVCQIHTYTVLGFILLRNECDKDKAVKRIDPGEEPDYSKCLSTTKIEQDP
ncbi:unnamed protein product [Lepeophtheirus salmonis]|uniref:(salmon louse) hypothetical protein n=1 Tax=Lepeophtheirus salmonis TaxID=72036 RepID=A0A7R8CV31_LEPSM|nr:unnamed protein product [Lepeophtheirus salmonis]CAF2939984.1 unnamed protein product [Lepeophtheirus salmonis]